MNDALSKALEATGITSERDRARFAVSLGVSERTLRAWLHEGRVPQPYWRDKTARRLKVEVDSLWPPKDNGNA